MFKFDIPLQLSPEFKPKIWGRLDLSPIFSRPLNPNEPRVPGRGDSCAAESRIGEAWITGDAARFLNGPAAGKTLAEVASTHGPELCGSRWRQPRFPILAKYVFTDDWLSVQVHPDDDYARTHDPGSPGKSEMWYIVQTEAEAEALLGLKPGTTREKLKEASQSGRSAEWLLRFHPQEGEAIFVPPGTVHALGPGLVLFEVEQNSDLTYRLDDYGRAGTDGKPRPLHLSKGLAVIRPTLPVHRNLPHVAFPEPYGSRRFVLACHHFALEELTLKKMAKFHGFAGCCEVISVLEGEGRVETLAGWMGTRAGDTWLVPPAAAPYRWVPRKKTRLLKFYRPDLERDFRQPLARRGVSSATISKIVFD